MYIPQKRAKAKNLYAKPHPYIPYVNKPNFKIRGNINPNGVSMFEPIGGTAPNFTGLDQINPMAAIGAAHLMLDHLGYFEAANELEVAKIRVIKKMKSMLAGKMGFKTSKIGNMISDELSHMDPNQRFFIFY